MLRKIGGDGDGTSQHRAGPPEREGSGERVIAVDHRVDTVEHLIDAANLGNMPAIAAAWWAERDKERGGRADVCEDGYCAHTGGGETAHCGAPG